MHSITCLHIHFWDLESIFLRSIAWLQKKTTQEKRIPPCISVTILKGVRTKLTFSFDSYLGTHQLPYVTTLRYSFIKFLSSKGIYPAISINKITPHDHKSAFAPSYPLSTNTCNHPKHQLLQKTFNFQVL